MFKLIGESTTYGAILKPLKYIETVLQVENDFTSHLILAEIMLPLSSCSSQHDRKFGNDTKKAKE